MHHFMSTPMPRTSTKCHTLSAALSLLRLDFLSALQLCSLSPPPHPIPPFEDGAERVFAPSSLSSLFPLPLSCSVLSGEADRPHSKGRPRRPLLTRLSVTPLPHPSRPPFHPTDAPRAPSPPAHPQCTASVPLLFTLRCCLSHLPDPSLRTPTPSFRLRGGNREAGGGA